ncbi:hypothetical protein FAVG1_06400 [Fusarium avenaceum]|nr:hypothetical protein FAVG1_06400 [Fusarium avenaceum]
MSSFTPINRPIQQDTNSTASNENNPNITACNKNNQNSISGNMGKRTNSVRLHPWQLRALQNGRTPLPEAPGAILCIEPRASSQVAGSQSSNPPSSIDVLASSAATNTDEASGTEVARNQILFHQAPVTNIRPKATSITYRFWSGDDMRSLIALRNSGATWPDIYAAFPERTPEAIKQAYHKRRHAIEREMAMEDWQERAIREGRTHLPDFLGDKPSLATVGNLPAHPKSAQTGTSSHRSSSATVSTPASSLNQSYRFWSESDLHRLIEMRNGGMEWNAIAVEFPDRTLESIKQTFHKRRHAVEKRMAEERADTSN